MAETLKRESRRHADAYAYCLQLGGKRSYAKVAEKFGFSETSVRKWARSFGWKERKAEADEQANDVQCEKAREGYVSTVEDFKDLKEAAFQKMQRKLNSGECSVTELCKILKAIKTELGEPTVITQSTPQINSGENPFADILHAVFPPEGESKEEALASREPLINHAH